MIKKTNKYVNTYQHFIKFKQGLVDTLKDLNLKRKSEEGYSKDHFNLQDLDTALNFIEADFSKREKDYLKMQLYKETFDLNRLEINSVMKIFNGKDFENHSTFHTAEILSPKSPKKFGDFKKEMGIEKNESIFFKSIYY